MVSAIHNTFATAYNNLNGLSWRAVFTLPGMLAAMTCFLIGLGVFLAAFFWWIYPAFIFPMIFG